MARNIYGLDLGSYEIKVYDKKKDTIWKEKDVIAIADKNEIFAVGDDAYEMYEKAPSNIEVVFPMKLATPAALKPSSSMLPLILIFPVLEQFFMEPSVPMNPATPAALLPSAASVTVISALFLQPVSVPPS